MKDYMKVKRHASGKGRLVSKALWKYDEYWIFLGERFSFYEIVPFPPDTVSFFLK